ncbi:MAG: SdrD B-like domain-containing protein [Saprospiraceae bacterium]
MTLSTTTDANGAYAFDNLLPGNYTVTLSVPNGYNLSLPNNGNDDTDSDFIGTTMNVTLVSNQSVSNIDAGLYRNASIGDFVWEDSNANGIQDTGETGISNVTLTLTGNDGAGNAVTLSTTTDTNGAYAFDNLVPGSYTVTLSVPNGYNLSLPNNGNDATDSDFVTTSTNVAVVSNQSVSNIDAGLYRNASIGDFVWEDSNANGIQDTGETGISNVTLTLTGNDGTGNAVTLSTTTDANGAYAFDNLLPGNYTVTLSVPNGYNLSLPNNGNDDTDSDFIGTTVNVTLISNQSVSNIDAGLYRNASIGDFVWEDSNANGIQDTGETGISNVTLFLSGTSPTSTNINLNTKTDVNGWYTFGNLIPSTYSIVLSIPDRYHLTKPFNSSSTKDSNFETSSINNIILTTGSNENSIDAGLFRYASIGDFVWEDSNANGIQDTGETGISNVTLTLTGNDGAGNAVTLSTTTDTNGAYAFDNLAPGNYNVTLSVPNGYNLSLPNNGNDATDSDFVTTSTNVTVVSNQSVSNIDAVYIAMLPSVILSGKTAMQMVFKILAKLV